MNEEKIKEVFSNEKFVKSLLEMETPEEVRKALAEKDIDLSVDEIKAAAQLLEKRANGELTDEELENVAGGMGVITGLILTAIGVTVGSTAIGVGIQKAVRRRW